MFLRICIVAALCCIIDEGDYTFLSEYGRWDYIGFWLLIFVLVMYSDKILPLFKDKDPRY